MSKDITYQDASTSQLAASSIHQKVLDELSTAIMAWEPDALIERIHLPFRMATQNSEFLIETEQDWLDAAKRFHRNLKALGVNHYIRLVTEADFLSENYIEGFHVTHTMCNATPMVPSYMNRATLTRVDGVWKISALESAMTNESYPISMPRIDASTKAEFPRYNVELDMRRTAASPLALYQDYLDALSRTNMEDDFEGWCALCSFPHTVHIEQIDETISHPEQIRPFFDMLRGLIKEHDVDELRRTAERAEFISPTRICGYHNATLHSKGELKFGPIVSRYILERTDTHWRVISLTNAVKNNEFPYSIPELSDALVSLRDIQERTTRQ